VYGLFLSSGEKASEWETTIWADENKDIWVAKGAKWLDPRPSDGSYVAEFTPPKYASLAEAKTARLSEVDQLRLTKTFTDVAVDFPSGDKKEIQFRNEFDMSNLMSVATAGIALIVSGAPTAEVVYRTKDNTTQTVTAAQMVSVGVAVLSAKQAVVSAAWTHKDAIRQLETIEAVEAYDLTVGWPV